MDVPGISNLDDAIFAASSKGVDAILMLSSTVIGANQEYIAGLTLGLRLPRHRPSARRVAQNLEIATAFPPGSPMVQGRAAIEAMWKSMAEQVSDPKLSTLDVKPLGPSAAREIGTFSLKTKGPAPQQVVGKYVVVWEKIGTDWKLAADIWNDGK